MVDLAGIVRPGDTVMWGQGTGEPRTLTEALVAQRAELGPVTVFLGSTLSDTLTPDCADHLRFVGIGGIGRNAALARAGVLDVLPCHISTVPRLIESGRLPVDVALVQVSPAGPNGLHSLGLVADYVPSMLARARTVVAEINEQVPFVLGDAMVSPEQLHHRTFTSRPPVTVPAASIGPAERTIGTLVSECIIDGAVLQLGIGAVPQAIAQSLAGKKELGIHSGVIGDWIVDLMRGGSVTNERKPIDRGVTVTGALFGSRHLYEFAHANEQLALRPLTYTHDPATLRHFTDLFAVNSAIEVDLGGQVNAETVGGCHVGAVGGQVDFVRAAVGSTRGRSVIALPSTARCGTISRIVPHLQDGVVTTPRSDADLVVTEHGVADLRGVPLRERARRLIDIADPAHQEELRRWVLARSTWA